MGGRTGFAAAIVIGLIAAAPAGAATITVNTSIDLRPTPGAGCSLREAIATVDGKGDGNCGTADSGGNTIVLGASTYPLTLADLLFSGGPPVGCISTSIAQPDDDSSGELSVSGTVQNLTIEGAGPGRTVIDACKLADRALEVMAGASVTLKDLTITNGHAQDGADGTAGINYGSEGGAAEPGEPGGGILNEGNLTLIDAAVTDSHAGDGGTGGEGGPLGGSGGIGGGGGSGGGIESSGTLTLRDTTISGNSAGNGGAGGTAIVGSTSNSQSGNGGSGNSGGNGGGGGGIANEIGTATIEASTISGNASGAGGAGTSGQSSAPEKGNGGNGGNGGSGGNGAGISSAGSVFTAATLQATNDTVQGNIAGNGAKAGNPGSAANDLSEGGQGGNGGDGGYGGGLVNLLHANTQLVNLTIAENSAGTGSSGGSASESHPAGSNGSKGHGGGIYAYPSSPTLQNTILYENQPGDDCRGTIINGGHNLAYSPPQLQGLVTDACDLTGFSTEDPELGALGDNGGPTQTMRLQPGSPAIDQVPAAGAGCPATDQRGVARPGGTACDIGAYESAPPRASTGAASQISMSGGTVSTTVLANAPDATVQFQYGTSAAYGSSTTPQTALGLIPVSLTARLSSLSPGTTYHYRVVATSPDGTSFGADETFTTSAAAAALPVISNAAQSHRSWREGTRLASFSRKRKLPPLGTTFSFDLNVQANVTFVFSQQVGGRSVHGRCVAQTRKNHGGRACKRNVTRGVLPFTGHAGENMVVFQGRISHTAKLKLGGYTLVITATNAAGQQSAPTRLSFAIVK